MPRRSSPTPPRGSRPRPRRKPKYLQLQPLLPPSSNPAAGPTRTNGGGAVARDNKPPEMDGALIVVSDEPSKPRPAAEAEPQEDGKAELAVEMVAEIVQRMALKLEVQIREDADEVVLD